MRERPTRTVPPICAVRCGARSMRTVCRLGHDSHTFRTEGVTSLAHTTCGRNRQDRRQEVRTHESLRSDTSLPTSTSLQEELLCPLFTSAARVIEALIRVRGPVQ
eukprot:7116840-Prymnesium_polylepis.2